MTHKTMSSKRGAHTYQCAITKKSQIVSSVRRHIICRLSRVRGPVYILHAQVMSRQVHVTFIGTDIHLQTSEYQWYMIA